MSGKKERIAALKEHARHMRITALKMANRCGGNAHLGGGLSIMEAMAVLYGAVMNSRDLPYAEQDKFILSKGHGVLGLYTALAEFGVMDEKLDLRFEDLFEIRWNIEVYVVVTFVK